MDGPASTLKQPLDRPQLHPLDSNFCADLHTAAKCPLNENDLHVAKIYFYEPVSYSYETLHPFALVTQLTAEQLDAFSHPRAASLEQWL